MCLGIPGRIVKINQSEPMLATVDICGVRRQVNIACVVDEGAPAESCVGAWVLVHVGFAMSRIDETEASMLLDADTKAKVVERLKSALRELGRINDAVLNAERFQQEAKNAADRAAALAHDAWAATTAGAEVTDRVARLLLGAVEPPKDAQ